MTDKVTETELRNAMLANLTRIESAIGTRHRMRQMLASPDGIVAAWRRLPKEPSSGWTALFEAGLLEFSFESLVTGSERFMSLFTPIEVAEMLSSLKDVGYPASE